MDTTPTAATARDVARLLRLTPLSTLLRRRGRLVAMLLEVPELHPQLRSAWSREAPTSTAQVFAWVEQARLHRDRSIAPVTASRAWMRDQELQAAA